MSSLRKLPNSRFWIACFTDQDGHQRQRSTKVSDRAKALKIADEYEKAYRAVRTESQARRVVADIFEEVNDAKLPWSSARDFFAEWLKRKKVETSNGTFVRYVQIIGSFERHLGNRADKDLGSISKGDVQQFRDEIATRLSPTSGNIYLKILRSMFADAWRDDLITDNPSARIKMLKVPEYQSSRRPFTPEEFERLLTAADKEWRGIILAGLYTAQRLGDVARLTWAAVDFEKMEIHFPVQKTGHRLTVPLHEALKSYLAGMRGSGDGNDPVFPLAARVLETQGRTGTLSNQFYDLLVKAGLIKKRPRRALLTRPGRAGKRQTNELSFHSIRHMSTSLMKNAGVSDAVAMDLVGHESKAISANYTHIDDSSRRSAIQAMRTFTWSEPSQSPTRQSPSKRVYLPHKLVKVKPAA